MHFQYVIATGLAILTATQAIAVPREPQPTTLDLNAPSAPTNGTSLPSISPDTEFEPAADQIWDETAPEVDPSEQSLVQPITDQQVAASAAAGNLPSLNAKQTKHVRAIIKRVKANKMPKRACKVAIIVVQQESSIRMLANKEVPASLKYPHEGFSGDLDSIGLYQQRNSGWGTVACRMSAACSSNSFLKALKRTKGWEKMTLAQAAQKVQVSGHPDAYKKWVGLATKVCDKGW